MIAQEGKMFLVSASISESRRDKEYSHFDTKTIELIGLVVNNSFLSSQNWRPHPMINGQSDLPASLADFRHNRASAQRIKGLPK